MEHVRLGKTGLKVSRIALGCMSYGDPATTGAHTWALDDDDAQPFFRQAVEMGVNLGYGERLPALDLHLTDDEIRSLEEPYTPHGPAWY